AWLPLSALGSPMHGPTQGARQHAGDRAGPRREGARPLPPDSRLPAGSCYQGRSVPESPWDSWPPFAGTLRDPSVPPKLMQNVRHLSIVRDSPARPERALAAFVRNLLSHMAHDTWGQIGAD